MNEIEKIKAMAEQLYALRKEIDTKREAFKAEIEPLEAQKDALTSLLVAEMEKVGIKSIKSSNGDTYTEKIMRGVEIVSETGALKWAIENMAVSVNKTLVRQKLKDATEVPPCFALVETKTIAVKKAVEEKAEQGTLV